MPVLAPRVLGPESSLGFQVCAAICPANGAYSPAGTRLCHKNAGAGRYEHQGKITHYNICTFFVVAASSLLCLQRFIVAAYIAINANKRLRTTEGTTTNGNK